MKHKTNYKSVDTKSWFVVFYFHFAIYAIILSFLYYRFTHEDPGDVHDEDIGIVEALAQVRFPL